MGCAEPDELSTVEIALVEGQGCEQAEVLQELRSVSVEVRGVRNGQACILGRRCVSTRDASTVMDIESALEAAAQPLVALDADGAEQVAVLGHGFPGCLPGELVACGFASLPDATQGVLEVGVECGAELCPEIDVPFCP